MFQKLIKTKRNLTCECFYEIFQCIANPFDIILELSQKPDFKRGYCFTELQLPKELKEKIILLFKYLSTKHYKCDRKKTYHHLRKSVSIT